MQPGPWATILIIGSLLRAPKPGPWIQVFGLRSASPFVAECRQVGAL